MEDFPDLPKRKPISLAEFVGDLRSLVFKTRTDAAKYFHLDRSAVSRYENAGDSRRAPLGYLACLAIMAIERQREHPTSRFGKPEYVLKEINRFIQIEYEAVPFRNWDVLVTFANQYLQQQNEALTPENEPDSGKEKKLSSIPKGIGVLDRNSPEHPLYVTLETPKFSPGSAPPVPSMMIGRDDDMRNLKQNLGIGGKAKASFQVLTAVKGWPGVGKTTIASALAHDPDIVASFPHGVLWVSLGQEPNVLSEMATWGRALGTDEILKAKSVEEAQNLLASLLRNKRMLLIVDDIWKAEDAFPFKVGGPGCATLMTTRLDGVANALAPTADSIYRLKVLNDDDALELIRQLAPSVVEQYPAECLVLVQELEGLPLALQVAGRLLNTEANAGFGVIELISELHEEARLLAEIAPSDRMDFVTETTPTIGALLQKSLDLLNDATKDCYAYLGVFAPKPATFDMDAMKFIWQVEDPKPTIRTLVDRGLLEFVPELARYQIHSLLVMLAKSLLVN